MSSTNRDAADMPLELQLQQEALAARAGRAFGTAFGNIYQITSTTPNDESDNEEESWAHRGRHNTRRSTRIDTFEADGSDSDGEHIAQEHGTSTIGGLGRQIQLEVTQGNVSEADRAVFEEYFGDPYRRPTSPTGRGWQNRAFIAAGERITNEVYGSSMNAIHDTTLVDPVVASAGPPAGLCASRRVHQRHNDVEAERVRQAGEADRAMRAHNREQTVRMNLGRLADACEDALREHRRSHDLDAMRSELNARAMAFKGEDPAGFEKWADYITVAHACSTSKSRQHQIIQWYTRGVPGRVLRQVRRVEIYYTTEQYLKERLLDAQVYTGARRATDMRYHPKDDDRWAGNKKQLFFGYEPESSINGFADYVPKGEGADMIKHLRLNFAARRLRLRHASAQHVPVLVDMLEKFAIKVRAVLEQARLASAGDAALEQLFARAGGVFSLYLSNPPAYQPEGGSSSSVDGVRGAHGSDGNESDGSDVAAIANGFENATRLLEARALDGRDEARERTFFHRMMAQGGDEEDVSGDVPADGEDDGGNASMDESSSP